MSGTQFAMLLAFLMGAKILYLFPTLLSSEVGSSAWLSASISTLVALLGLWGWILWAKATGTDSLVSSLDRTTGRVLGNVIILWMLVSHIIATSWSMRMFVGGAVIALVPKFPIDALIGIMVLSSIYAAWLGVEAVGRAALFFFTPTIISLALVIASMFKTFHVQNLLPFWGLGAKATLRSGVMGTGIYGAISVLGVMKSYVRKTSDLTRGSLYGTLITAFLIVASLVALAGIFPYPMNSRKVEPLGVMARSVFLGRFLQRLEALFTFTWFFTSAVQASFGYMLMLILISQLAGCGTYRPFIPAIATLTFAVAGIPASTLRATELMDLYFTRTSANGLVVLGWVLFLVAKARGVRPAQGGEKQNGDKRNPQSRSS